MRPSAGLGSAPTARWTISSIGAALERRQRDLLHPPGRRDVAGRFVAALGGQQDDRLGAQAAQGVPQRVGGHGVEPLQVVDGDDHGSTPARGAEDGEDGPAPIERVELGGEDVGAPVGVLEEVEEAGQRAVQLLLGGPGGDHVVAGATVERRGPPARRWSCRCRAHR